MRKNNNPETTLLAFVRIATRKHAVTFSYKKTEDADVEVRTVEVEDVTATEDGHFVVVGWCRERQARRTFRLDRVLAYTTHRSPYTAAHRVFLRDEETEQLVAMLAEPSREPQTASEYDTHGDWLAVQADRADARGFADEAERLYGLADLAWELADLVR